MNRKLAIMLITTFLASLIGLGADEYKETVKKQDGTTVIEEKIVKKETEVAVTPNVPYCLSRGILSLATCPLEIPRCMIYDNAQIPVIGLVGGVVEGAFITVFRALSGTLDIVSLGFDGRGLHSDRFPDFIWESKWLPTEKQTIIEKEKVTKEN